MRLEWPKSKENPKVILREKSMLRHNYIQIRVYKINKGRVTYYSQSISVKVKKKFVVQAKWWLSDKKPCVSYKIFQTFSIL